MPIIKTDIKLDKLYISNLRNFDEEEERWSQKYKFDGVSDEEIGFHWASKYTGIGSSPYIMTAYTNLNADLNDLTNTFTVIFREFSESQLLLSAQIAGELIFKRGVQIVQTWFDDRPLYWGRISIRRMIKKHPIWDKIFSIFGNDRGYTNTLLLKTLNKFDEASRNFKNLNFNTNEAGNPIPSSHRKILVSGFDTFTSSGSAMHSSNNFSAVLALYLHGRELTAPNGKKTYLQACVFPVRYDVFNRGTVEGVFFPHMDNLTTIVDGIYSFSLDENLNKIGNYVCVVERIATQVRGPGEDNNAKKTEREEKVGNLSNAEANKFGWIQSTLPKNIIGSSGIFHIKYRQKFTQVIRDYKTGDLYWRPVHAIPTGNSNKLNLDYFLEGNGSAGEIIFSPEFSVSFRVKTRPILKSDIINKGSGGAFLSNEIFYRIALMRERLIARNPADVPFFPTGHIHFPKVTPDDANILQYLEFVSNQIAKGAMATVANDYLTDGLP